MLYPQLVTCSRIQSFERLVIRFCGDLVRWKSSTVSALGSSSCPSAHMSGVWIHMAATSLTMQRLASDLVINPLTSLCFYISVPPICLAPLASCAANMHKKAEWNAGITNMTVREGDVHDCDPVRQGHVSAFLVTSSEFARESLASQFCSPTALTPGRFAASLCLCLSMSDEPSHESRNAGILPALARCTRAGPCQIIGPVWTFRRRTAWLTSDMPADAQLRRCSWTADQSHSQCPRRTKLPPRSQ